MFFNDQQIADFEVGLQESRENFHTIRTAYIRHPYVDDRAREFATHGFGRRLGDLLHCIERVFELLPPSLEAIPDRATTVEATIHLQAFILNVFGCCDNLAWIWVSEKGLRGPNQRELRPTQIGFNPHQQLVRASFSDDFISYLDERQEWFDHTRGFRDALAHRIPLYVPPYVVDPANAEQYAALGTRAHEALYAGRAEEYDELIEHQKRIGVFCPIMTHSFGENARPVVFHAQLLADFATVHELAEKVLEQLQRE